MSDADDADQEARATRLHAQREELRRQREERDQHWEELMAAADRVISRIAAQSKALAGRLKRRASVLTVVGAAAGVALTWGASQTGGFWSLLMNALGTGLLAAAVVTVAAYFVSRYWKAATEIPNEAIFSELKEVHLLLIHASVAMDSSYDVLERLDTFLLRQEAERQAEEEERKERTVHLMARLRERGHLPPETGEPNPGDAG